MARRRNPIPQMPGGSVTECIKIMKRRGDIDDPGAYCAAIADKIEPGWRENPNAEYVEIFDALKPGQTVEVAMRSAMGTSAETDGRFHSHKVGRRSHSKKYGITTITLVPLSGSKPPRFARFALRKRADQVSASHGDMSVQLVGLRLPGSKGQNMRNPKKKVPTLHPGDLVKYTTNFLRSTGQYASNRIDGIVVGISQGMGSDYVFVVWNDASDMPVSVGAMNLQKKKTQRSRRDLLLTAKADTGLPIGESSTPYPTGDPSYRGFIRHPRSKKWKLIGAFEDFRSAESATDKRADTSGSDFVVLNEDGMVASALRGRGDNPAATNDRVRNLARRMANPE